MEGKTAWMPLESNPEVMTKFLRGLGVPNNWQLVDVLGLDPELLQMVPRPVAAVLLLFPTSEEYKAHCLKQEEELKSKGESVNQNVYFMKQTISNACGSIALIHAIANNLERIQLESDKGLKKFIDATKNMSPESRAARLEKDEVMSSAHEEHAQEGQTSAPNPMQPVNLHFVTFVNVENTLYELDGRKPFPIVHGPTSDDSLLEDASKVCKQFMERDPKEVNFSVVALTATPGDH
uniref:Ubiquitin carboxyl-terminal hydrolase n=1 Tax=Scolopendra viridis TaxID=118503 RepID=A0A4D5RA75_SCOVI